MHTVPEKPEPEHGPGNAADSKRNQADAVLIVGLTVSPLVVLLLVWISGALDAAAWTALFSGLLVACTIAQALIAKWQRDTMADQMEITRKQLVLTEQELEQTKAAADAAAMSAKAALATVDQMRLEKRPWIGVGKVELFDLIVGKPIECKIPMINSGGTPGYITKAWFGIGTYPIPFDIEGERRKYAREMVMGERHTVMAPNFNRLWTSDTGRPLSESELIAITQFPYRTVIALQGKIVYLDIDNGEHVTEWCMYFDPTVNDVLVHTNGNYMD